MLYVIFPCNINTATIIINNSINFETADGRQENGVENVFDATLHYYTQCIK